MARIHRLACNKRGLSPTGYGAKSVIARALGISPQAYGNFLGGRTTLERVAAIAEELGVDPGDPTPLWGEVRRLLDDLEEEGLDVQEVRAALP